MSHSFICFIVSGFKTPLFYAVSQYLEQHFHIKSLWISPNAEWASWLVDNGVKEDFVHDSSRKWDRRTGSPEGRRILSEIERNLPYSVNNIIKIDRNLREKKKGYALNYLESLLEGISFFSSGKNISHVFSEQTWAFDIVSVAYLESKGALGLMPHTVRQPSNRFSFFRGALQKDFLTENEPTEKNLREAEEYLSSFEETDVKPFYFQSNNKSPKLKASYIKSAVRHFKWSNDETKNTIFALAKHRVMAFFRFKSVNRASKNDWLTEPLKGQKNVFLTLHKQPEASIDLLDYHNSNQKEFIKSVAGSLPLDTVLLVKEHSNALGDRGRAWYKELVEIDNIHIVSPYVSSRVFVQEADLTLSVSGTASLEAAMLGKKAICTANVHFRGILVSSNTTVKELECGLKNIDSYNEPSREAVLNFLSYVYANSYEGIICDSKTLPSVLDETNVVAIANAFHEVIKL